jgi:myo-inositol-1(or 4)-monophosphatase
MSHPTPRQILETLLPHLRVAAAYAHQVQPYIAARPTKEADNLFGAALSDADLSVQTFIEVALLSAFPNLRFYGEEYERSYNTKYFRAIDLGEQDDYLVTLDPIDGTRFYLDGHSNYQIIVGVLNRDEFEAAIAITPAEKTYCYALRGQGCWYGNLEDNLESCQPLRVQSSSATVFLGIQMGNLAPRLADRYTVIPVATAYSETVQIPNVNGILTGELAGVIIRKGQFIDGAALAFMAQEAGAIATTHDGSPLPPLHQCQNYQRPGLLIATSPTVHQDLVEAIRAEAEMRTEIESSRTGAIQI